MVEIHDGPGLVSSKQRKYLIGESDIEPKSQRERQMRSEIRKRLRNALRDFEIVRNELPERDWNKLAAEIREDDAGGSPLRNGLYWAVALSLRFGSLTGDDMETVVDEGVLRSDPEIFAVESDIDVSRGSNYEPGTVTEKLRNGEQPNAGEIAIAFQSGELDEYDREKLQEVGFRPTSEVY